MSLEDNHFLDMVNQSIEFKQCHYVVGLPLKSLKAMPNNRKQAGMCLSLLNKRLTRDTGLCELYEQYHIQVLCRESLPQSTEDQNKGKNWYVPHHRVFHPKKKKIRVVVF